jgi:serine/threonine-protein kinase
VSDDVIGQVVDDRFEIRGRLGQGGMATVYRALQRSVGREVAIKLIDQRYASDGMGVRRFLREARLASQLAHPNTVSVLDAGQSSDGRLFIAMELVRGRTLADVIAKEGPFPVDRAARIGVQLCDGLEAAHKLEILHRDLKPSNIMVLDDPPGRDAVKILDFGLAKSLAEEESQVTATGYVIGTPGFMAPELVRGAEASTASDIYSMGVVLTEMVSGKAVWGAGPTQEVEKRQAGGMPARLGLPPSIRPLIERLLSPDPAQRPASAGELRQALLALIGSRGRVTNSAPPRRSWLLPAAIAAALLAAAAVMQLSQR